MTQSQIAAERALEIWQFMLDELARVVRLLSDAQLNMRIAPNERSLESRRSISYAGVSYGYTTKSWMIHRLNQ